MSDDKKPTFNGYTQEDWDEVSDNPELTAEDFARAKRHRGRPKLAAPKQQVTLRLDADLLAGLRATGPGWQGRVNDALREWLRRSG